MRYVILEKAKPYTRTRRGKLEFVRGYVSRAATLFPAEQEHAGREAIEGYLKGVSGMMPKREGMAYSGFENFVWENGQWFKPATLPKDVKEGLIKDCFMNAWHLATERKDLTYVEGFALGLAPIPVMHAWCADKEGNVIDPTWGTAKAYYGVPFTTEFIIKTAMSRKKFGVIDNMEEGFPLMRKPFKEGKAEIGQQKVSEAFSKPSKVMTESEYKAKYTGKAGVEYVASMVRKAVQENSGRLTHGYTDEKKRVRDTGWSGFFIVAMKDRIYTYKDWGEIAEEDRPFAWSVHSHSGAIEDWRGRVEDFQPLNAGDIHIWFRMLKSGACGDKLVIIMADGRMEILELTEKTDPKVLKWGLNRLIGELHRDYPERAKYYEEHKSDPGYETYKQERELLRSFCKKYGINYYENLNWKDPRFVKSLYVILEKAKPYTRVRRGKFEHVKGYAGRPRKPEISGIKPAQASLAKEALKYDTFEEFEYAYSIEIKHGRYWHVTDDPNFHIDPLRGPRDMSSMAHGEVDPGKLMVTTDLPWWSIQYPGRRYVAEIDMTEVPKETYKQVKRGFGNEFFVSDPSKARVIKVVSKATALADSRRYDEQKPQSREELRKLWDAVQKSKALGHPEGHWDRSGDEPRWVQDHDSLVRDALHSWVGSPSDMAIHISEELEGKPEPGSGSGKIMRAQARALLKEFREKGKPNDKTLYRSSGGRIGIRSWSENKRTAHRFAKLAGTDIETLKPGEGRGLRVADYIESQMDQDERQWLIFPKQDEQKKIEEAFEKPAKTIVVGKKVVIKSGWMKGQWGTVKFIDADNKYHIAPFNDPDTTLVFDRDEISIHKEKRQDMSEERKDRILKIAEDFLRKKNEEEKAVGGEGDWVIPWGVSKFDKSGKFTFSIMKRNPYDKNNPFEHKYVIEVGSEKVSSPKKKWYGGHGPKGDPFGSVIHKSLYVILEKAKPYTRVRRGKFEHVKGYAGRSKSLIRAYHGSPMELKEIGFGEGVRSLTFLGGTKTVKSGAIFFTPDKETAGFFARNRAEWLKDLGKETKPSVYERYLNIKNPADFTTIESAQEVIDKAKIDLPKIFNLATFDEEISLETYIKELGQIDLDHIWKGFDKPEFVEALKRAGYDGAIIKETGDRGISYAIFDPKQALKGRKS